MTAEPDVAFVLAQLRRRERWLMALAAVRTELLSGGPTDRAMALIASECAALGDADGVVILLSDADGSAVVTASSGRLAAGVRDCEIDDADPWLTALTTSLESSDAAALPAPAPAAMAVMWERAGPILVVPMVPAQAHGGVLVCLRGRGSEPFDNATRPEIVGLAEQGALALDMAARAARRRSSALMADRERIARDLHDHVIQRLFAVGLSLQGQVARIDDPAVHERVDDAVGEIDAAIAELRSSIFDLRTADDATRKTLRRRLANIAATVRSGAADSGPRVSIRVSGPVDTVVGARLADDVEAVVREAISNAVRHAGARTVLASVMAGDSVQVVVTDDGRGIPDEVARSGLKNLAQRAADHGGTFRVARIGADSGTRLEWSVPLS